ncbi:DUF1648 domain-containing protein [Bifidobacterium moukalabense]|uniref:DUF1648 domain-containing protein n=1 Tax=Bifidobacterium moukalabense TaxID=1333651 RepID=UPI0010FA2D48|nr:DUF5808 domain-containing protein [Bifidobacterium moukalabense]
MTNWMMVAMVALEGVSVTLAPWMVRRTVCFGVSVPVSAQRDPGIRRAKIGYTACTGSVSAIAVAASIVCLALWGALGGTIAATATSLLLIVVSFALVVRYRKRTMQIKHERGWNATKLERAAFLAENAGPEPLGLHWELLHLVPVIIMTVSVFVLYDSMPDRLPIHANAAGRIDGWLDKSLWAVLGMPLLIQLIMAATMTAVHAMIIHSPRRIDPEHPSISGYAYGRFSRAWSVYVLIVGLTVNLGFIGLTPMYANWWGIRAWGSVMMLIALAIIVAALVLAVIFGQCGSRTWQSDGENEDGNNMADDDGDEWVLGMFYYSPENPAIVVPKRMGVGYTFNMAHPLVWLICAALVLLLIVSLALPLISG